MRHPRSKPVLSYLIYAFVWMAVFLGLVFIAYQWLRRGYEMPASRLDSIDAFTALIGLFMFGSLMFVTFFTSLHAARKANKHLQENYDAHLRHMGEVDVLMRARASQEA